MASPRVEDELEAMEPIPLSPPVPDGDDHLESLGRFVDSLLGSMKRQAAADRRFEELVAKTGAPDDPPPIEIPEPVPDGDDPFTHGKDLGDTETREA